jgi:uncharacterized membrane protein YeaQ/YmgE (transglycosylase-associated protein family)
MIRFIFTYIIIGALSGYLAGKVMKGKGFGFTLNLLLGIVGSLVGGFLFQMLRMVLPGGFIGSLISAFVGAVLVLIIGNILHGRKRNDEN